MSKDQKRNKFYKKAVAVILAIAMIVTCAPAASMNMVQAAAGAADGQVENVGGTTTVSQAESGTGFDITISKTIEAVSGKENYFDITLTASTHRHERNTDTDVVVVMDISNTMNYRTQDNTEPQGNEISRLAATKAAVKSFLDEYVGNEKLSARNFGLVTFNTNATAVQQLTPVNTTAQANAIKGVVDGITASSSQNVRYTNVEGGLQLAKNMLARSNAAYKYVILITDGFPTTYIESGKNSTSSISGYNTIMGDKYGISEWSMRWNNANDAYYNSVVQPDTEGFFYDPAAKKICLYGVDYSNIAAQRAENVAKSMKNSDNVNIFTIGVALGSQDIENFRSKAPLTFTTVDLRGMTDAQIAAKQYVIGNNTTTYKAWLRDDISGGYIFGTSDDRYLDGNNPEELEQDLYKVMKNIENAPLTEMRQFYAVDPMGENIDFISFFDKDGNLVSGNLSGQSKLNAEDTAAYSNDTINWNLIQSGFTMETRDGYDWFNFDLKYRVRLENENAAYQWLASQKTNGRTTLEYTTTYTETGAPGPSDVIEYKIPEVEGYCGSLKALKTDEYGNALAGAGFTLSHNGEACIVCAGDATIPDMTAASDDKGQISFTDIPSGHSYTLSETTVPEGRKAIGTYKIIVSYGKTYLGSVDPANELVDYDDFVIINEEMEPVELQIQTEKTLLTADGTAKSLQGGEFRFLLKSTKVVDDSQKITQYKVNDSNGNITFDKLVFNKTGEYVYEVSEISGTDTGIVYDGAKHTVKIVVHKNTEGTALIADVSVDDGTAVSYIGKENTVDVIDAGSFVNQIRQDGKAQIVAAKTYLDADGNTKPLVTDQFTFVLVDENGDEIDRKGNDVVGNIVFDTITYNAPGTYVYTIKEVAGVGHAIVYDKAEYQAIVEVTAPSDLTDSSSYATAVTYEKDGKAVSQANFLNKDRKAPSLTLTGTKSFNESIPAADAFTFEMVEIDENEQPINGTEQTAKNDANGQFSFDFDEIIADMIAELEADASARATGYHNFMISEKAEAVAAAGESITYDGTDYILSLAVTAPVSKDSYSISAMLWKISGTTAQLLYSSPLSAEATNIVLGVGGEGEVSFANTSSVQTVISGTKQYLQQDDTPIAMTEGQFTFVLHNASGATVGTATNAADGSFSFAPITYTAEDVGIHTYIVHENTANRDKDVYYDSAMYTVSVEVSKDSAGHMSVTAPTYTKNGAAATDITFVNREADPTHLHVTAVKTVNGNNPTMDQAFNFKLETVQAPTGVDVSGSEWNQTVGNIGGHAVFQHIVFEQGMEGEYVFNVSEVLPAEATAANNYTYEGITYDTTVHTIKVTVTTTNGDVMTSVVVDNGTADTISTAFNVGFANTYTADPVTVTLGGNKTLTGRDMAAEEFEFVLLDKDGQVVTDDNGVPYIAKNKTAADGQTDYFTFAPITYDKVGTYTYTIKERAGDSGGVAYDTKTYRVVVTVTDSLKGYLEAAVTVNGQATALDAIDDSVAFANTYTTKPVSVRFLGEKTLAGKMLVRGEFSFQLQEGHDGTGRVLQTVTNGQLPNSNVERVVFDRITYNQAGTYKYTIKEVAANQGGITYDDAEYKVTVLVTDDGQGNLVAETNVVPDEDLHLLFRFHNVYKASPTNIHLEATKILNGKNLKAEEFEFELKDGQGTVLQTRTNDADGNIIFDDIVYDTAGRYQYTISEVIPGEADRDPRMTYDATVYHVDVVVTDDMNGKLIAAEPVVTIFGTSVQIEDMVFVNDYEPVGTSFTINGDKDLMGKLLEEEMFSFELYSTSESYGIKDAPIQVVKNGKLGAIRFAPIEVEKAGTYYFAVKEKTDSPIENILYDTSIYHVSVEVVNTGEGYLEVGEVTLAKRGTTEKVKEIRFLNKYDKEEEDPPGDPNDSPKTCDIDE